MSEKVKSTVEDMFTSMVETLVLFVIGVSALLYILLRN
jgi:hypothetical protein